MPASDQTTYPMKLLHRLFALASLALLATTVWMLVKDHQRSWKQYQRTASRIEGRVANWRKLQYETDEAVRQRQQLERQLAEARQQDLDKELLAQFRAQVGRDAHRRGVPEDVTGFDEACGQLDAFHRKKGEQADKAGRNATTVRAAVLARVRDLIANARLRENTAANVQKLRSADWDVAKAEVGLAVRAGRPATDIEQRQATADRLQAEVAELVRQHAAAKDHRLALEGILGRLTTRERELEKMLADSRAELARLEDTVADRRSTYFNLEHGFPLPGKKFLELPILDAFNSPLRIENLWAEGLTQDYNFRQVPRFDRCTTCHTAMQKTEPGSACAPAFPHEQILEFALSAGLPAPHGGRPLDLTSPGDLRSAVSARSGDLRRTRLTATQRGARAPESETPFPAPSLDQLLGLRLADEGLLNPNDVTISYVRPGTPAAEATLVTAPPEARSADQVVLDLFQTGDVTRASRVETGLKMGDVIVAIDGQIVASRQQAISLLSRAESEFAGAAGEARLFRKSRASDDAPSAPLVLTIRRGLPHPFSSHPRLDLFVGDLSPHKMSEFACTICHEGQGSATDFKWASHMPNRLADRQRWREQHGWFDNAFWDYPMVPRRFIESTCLKCHHRVADLRPSPRFPAPPAPKLLRGDALIRAYGCYGCHEINGYQGGRSVGPDLRTEPPDVPNGRETPQESPGQLRRPGPSLRYVGHKLQDAFLHDWLSDPQRFRPTTRMPRVFGLWNHLDDRSGRLAQQYEPLEIRGIVAYLRDRTQDPGPAASPAGISESSAAQRAERGRVLSQTRGCLACHSHAAFADADKFRPPDEILAGPDLSNMADKLTPVMRGSPPVVRASPDPAPGATDRSQESGRPAVGGFGEVGRPSPNADRAWLADFIRQPTRHLPRTIMPDLLLEPIQNRDSEGKVLSVTDPAEDIAEFLLQNPAAGYEPQLLPEIDETTLDQLTLEYLRGAYHESKAQQYVEQGIPSQLADTLQEAEKELIVPDQSESTAPSQTGGNESKTRLSVQQKLRYVGSKAIGKYGCFGCHDIPGFETAKQIGPPLSDWGRKDTTLLAFENITAYLKAHSGGPRVAEADKANTNPKREPENKNPKHERGDENPKRVARPPDANADRSDDPATVDYFRQQLAVGSRIGFIYQKLAEPRSYDYRVAQNKPYSDRLRMPQFPFDAEQREAIITFVLGLVAQPPTEKYVYAPDSTRSATIEGEILLDKYRCASCHVLEPQKWRLEYAPGDFQPQPEKAVFPFVDHVFRDDELRRSQQPDARGMLHATLVGMPTLGDDGRALAFDEAGDELLEDENEKYLPTTLEYPFQLWQPTALDGHGYQVGRTAVSVRGGQVVARQRSRGGFLAQYLLPRVASLEKSANPNAKGAQAWGWLPPRLLGEGAKVRPEWLHDYLLAPYAIRPASFMRMPKYNLSSAEAGALADYFAAQDRVAHPYQTIDRRDRAYLQRAEQAYREQQNAKPEADGAGDADRLTAAMRIVTDKNYCVTCHMVGDYDPRTSDRAKGPNLADVYKRLRPDYIGRWVAEPVSVLPYTGMPIIIPYQSDAPHLGGVAQSLYPGTSIQQLDALVDLLINFDAYTRGRAPVAPLVEAAAVSPTDTDAAAAHKKPATEE